MAIPGGEYNIKPLNILVGSWAHFGRTQSLVALCSELVRRGHNITFGIGDDFADKLRKLAVGPDASRIHIIPIARNPETVKANDEVRRGLTRRENSDTLGTLRIVTKTLSEEAKHDAPIFLDLVLQNEFDLVLADLNAGGLNIARYLAELLTKKPIPCVINHPILAQGEILGIKSQPGYYPAANEVNLYDVSFLSRFSNKLKRTIANWIVRPIVAGTFGAVIQELFDRYNLTVASKSKLFLLPPRPTLVGTAMGFEIPFEAPPHYIYTGPMIDDSVISEKMVEDDKVVQWACSNECSKGVFFISLGTSVMMEADEMVPLGRAFTDAAKYEAPDVCFLWSVKGEQYELLTEDIVADINSMGSRFRVEPFVNMRLLLKFGRVRGTATQGGVASVAESLYFGVPTVVIPFLFDQIDLAARVVATDSGINVGATRPHNATRVQEAIGELVRDNHRYKQGALRVRKMFQVAGGIKRGADVVETTAALGNDFLIPLPYREDAPWFVYGDVDVIVFLMTLTWLGFILVIKVMLMLGRRLLRSKRITKSKLE